MDEERERVLLTPRGPAQLTEVSWMEELDMQDVGIISYPDINLH